MLDVVKILGVIETDVEKDIIKLDGSLFNGRTVAKQFGYQGAAIVGMIKIVRTIFDKYTKKNEEDTFRIHELEKKVASLEHIIKSNNKET